MIWSVSVGVRLGPYLYLQCNAMIKGSIMI